MNANRTNGWNISSHKFLYGIQLKTILIEIPGLMIFIQLLTSNLKIQNKNPQVPVLRMIIQISPNPTVAAVPIGCLQLLRTWLSVTFDTSNLMSTMIHLFQMLNQKQNSVSNRLVNISYDIAILNNDNDDLFSRNKPR